MKIRSYNGSEHIEEECGSFTNLSRELNKQFKSLDIYSTDDDAFVVVPECLNTRRQFKKQIPFLACEYSRPPQFVTQWLKQYNPITFCISEFARQNLIRGGYLPELIHTSHLGNDANFWTPANVDKFPTFTFITTNTSNDRSGFPIFIPEFIKFAYGKNVRLYIKDGQNDKFESWVKSIDVENKIIYDGRRLSKVELRDLYGQSHINVYYNSTTSYGLNIGDGALCGLPTLATIGSAVQEFLPPWTQPPRIVTTTVQPLDNEAINCWQEIGLHVPPLNLYPPDTTREELDPTNIQSSLNYAYENYEEMLNKNKKHQELIRSEQTWEKCAMRIIEPFKQFS